MAAVYFDGCLLRPEMTELPPGVTYAYRNVQGYPEGDPLAANHYRYRANDRAAKGVSPPAQKATLNGPKWIDTRIKLSSTCSGLLPEDLPQDNLGHFYKRR